MPSFTVKNIPDDLYGKLVQAAKLDRRSINSQIISCIEKALQEHDGYTAPNNGKAEARQ